MVSRWLSVCPSVHPSDLLPYIRPSVFSYSKYQWIFTKLSVRTDIVEIWLGIVSGQISSIFDSDRSVFSFPDDNFNKWQWIFTKLGVCFDIVEICVGIADGQISSIYDRVLCPQHIRIFIFER